MGFGLQSEIADAMNTVPASLHSVTSAASAVLSGLVTAFDANLRRLTLIPRTGKTVHWNVAAAASANTPLVPAGGISFSCTTAVANTIYVYSADAGPNLDVIQHV